MGILRSRRLHSHAFMCLTPRPSMRGCLRAALSLRPTALWYYLARSEKVYLVQKSPYAGGQLKPTEVAAPPEPYLPPGPGIFAKEHTRRMPNCFITFQIVRGVLPRTPRVPTSKAVPSSPPKITKNLDFTVPMPELLP